MRTLSQRAGHRPAQVRFSAEESTHGAARWILISDLQTRRFSDETGEFLLELSLANAMTVFETDIRVPPQLLNHHHHHPGHRGSGAGQQVRGPYRDTYQHRANVAS